MDPSPSPRQLGLIGIAGPTARRDDPDTSFAAGRLVDVLNPSSTAYRILAELRAAGAEGRTDGESSAAMPDLWAPSVVKRRGDLVGWGLVVDSGRRRPSPRSGRKMVVWTITAAGIEALAQHRPGAPLAPQDRVPDHHQGDEDPVADVDTQEAGYEAAPLAQLEELAPPVAAGSTVALRLAEARARLAGRG